MTISTQGNVNPSSIGVPGVYVNINPPPTAPLSGAPSSIVGIVGTSNWGPVNSPVAVGSEAGASIFFGPMQARKYDLMTAVHCAALNGASNFRLVRQTDGTDTAAAATVQTNGGTATAIYTGTRGAQIVMTIANGSKPSTKKVTIQLPGLQAEVFDNIVAVAASNASWLAIAAAINTGIGLQPRSQLVVFSAGVSVAAPVNGAISLTGGNDGATTITSTVLIGSDSAPRTGLYALRSTGAAVVFCADNDDSTTWSTVAAFAQSEAAYGYGCSASGDTIANFITTMAGAATDTPWFKVIFGDWVYMIDGVNSLTRVVSPIAFAAGNKVAVGPQNSSLNKPLMGVVGTQKSYANQVYSTPELQQIGQARGDVIILNPPGGQYAAMAFGHNSSSDASRKGDNYTTLTNFLAQSLDQRAGTGLFIGRLITPDESRELSSTLGSFLHALWDNKIIGNAQGTVPYSVLIDNTQATIGVQKAVIQVQYLSVLEVLVVDVTGGQTVQILSQPNLLLAA